MTNDNEKSARFNLTDQLPAAILVGAVIVGGALIFHASKLANLAGEMQVLETRMGGLEKELDSFSEDLDTFSKDLPEVVGQAGREAGRQAVHGIFEEAFQAPLRQIAPNLILPTSSTAPGKADSSPGTGGAAQGPAPTMGFPQVALPPIQFNIPDTVINIDFFPNPGEAGGLPKIPGLSWPFGSTPDADDAMPEPGKPAADQPPAAVEEPAKDT